MTVYPTKPPGGGSWLMEQLSEGEIWEGGGMRYRMEKVVGNGAFGIVWLLHAGEHGGL